MHCHKSRISLKDAVSMENRRFDLLTRSLAGATNRRDFLRRLIGVAGVTGGVIALSAQETDAARRGYSGPKFPPTQQPEPEPEPCTIASSPCTANSQCCTGFCEQDIGSEGTCQTCDWTICADFVCVNLNQDPWNCGSCGHLCAQDESCNNGNCENVEPV
jgi:hypothetical protein